MKLLYSQIQLHLAQVVKGRRLEKVIKRNKINICVEQFAVQPKTCEVLFVLLLLWHPVIGYSMDYVDKNNKQVLSYLSWRNRDQTVSTTASHMLFCYNIWQTKNSHQKRGKGHADTVCYIYLTCTLNTQ